MGKLKALTWGAVEVGGWYNRAPPYPRHSNWRWHERMIARRAQDEGARTNFCLQYEDWEDQKGWPMADAFETLEIKR